MNQKPCPTRAVERPDVRNEGDLEQLRIHVLAAAHKTRRPASVSR